MVTTRIPLSDVADMSRSLHNINRATAAARARCANDPTTRALVWAGLHLIEKQFVDPRAQTPSEDDEIERDLLRFVSQRSVVSEARRGWPELDVKMTKYRDCWTSHSRYLADLVRFAITDRHWSLRVARDEAGRLLADTKDVAAAVHRIGYLDLLDSQQPLYRFQLIAATTVNRDPVVQQAIKEMYATVTEAWATVYEEGMRNLGLTLRPGVTIEDITHILSALAEGLALRLMSDPDAKVVDEETQTSLLGTAGVALFCACVDPGDGLTVEELLNAATSVLSGGIKGPAVRGGLRLLTAARRRSTGDTSFFDRAPEE